LEDKAYKETKEPRREPTFFAQKKNICGTTAARFTGLHTALHDETRQRHKDKAEVVLHLLLACTCTCPFLFFNELEFRPRLVKETGSDYLYACGYRLLLSSKTLVLLKVTQLASN